MTKVFRHAASTSDGEVLNLTNVEEVDVQRTANHTSARARLAILESKDPPERFSDTELFMDEFSAVFICIIPDHVILPETV